MTQNDIRDDHVLYYNFNKTKWVNRNLYAIENYISSYEFYIKMHFLKFIKLNKKVNPTSFNFKENFIRGKRIYLQNYLMKKKYFKLKTNYHRIHQNIDSNINKNICYKCSIMCTDVQSVNQIVYYQNLLKLNLINKEIFKFNFVFCNEYGYYKISIKEKYFINYFSTYTEIIKYFIKYNLKNFYIYYQKRIYNCYYVENTNYIFFDELKFIDLTLKKYMLKFFYFYCINQDVLYYNIKRH